MAYCISKDSQYTVLKQKSGVTKDNKKWQLIIPQEADRMTVFVDNDVELAVGDVFTVEKINAVTQKVVKSGDKLYNNINVNCEVKKGDLVDDIDGIDDIDDLDDVDLDRVIK